MLLFAACDSDGVSVALAAVRLEEEEEEMLY